MKLYLTGGAVRNHMLGVPTKDYDFAVEAESYEAMRAGLLERGLTIWQERPEFVTIRGQISLKNLGTFGDILPTGSIGAFNADFTLCRAEAMYSDLRHPDKVTPADLMTDMSRRDFTINAVAVSEHGVWFDGFDGRSDALNKTIDTVGLPRERFEEDPLRMLRAVRLAVCYHLLIAYRIINALNDVDLTDNLKSLPHERVREELNKALVVDWRRTMHYLMVDAPELGCALAEHQPNLWLKFTSEAR